MSIEIIEKLDAIEANNIAEIAKVTEAVTAKVDAVEQSFMEKVAALEAKVAQINPAPSILKIEKTVRGDVNKMVKEQLAKFYKENGRTEKELKMFEDASQYDAYMKEASALTAGGDGKGGRTAYDPVFVAYVWQTHYAV